MFRATNYPIGAVDPTDPNRVVVTYGSYINRNSNESTWLHPAGFAADGTTLHRREERRLQQRHPLQRLRQPGGSFSGTSIDPRLLPVVTDGPRQASTDQFWQGAAFTPTGTLVGHYYDRSYGNDNTTGYSDITVSASH